MFCSYTITKLILTKLNTNQISKHLFETMINLKKSIIKQTSSKTAKCLNMQLR